MKNSELFGKTRVQPLIKRKYTKGESPLERWKGFHEDNPHVYAALKEEALNIKAHGAEKTGMDMLYARLRWLAYMQIKRAAGDYKLNNNYRSFYARHLMYNEPELADFFEVRYSDVADSYEPFLEAA